MGALLDATREYENTIALKVADAPVDGQEYTRKNAGWVVASAAAGGGTPASSVVTETTYGQSSAVGTGTNYAREDHTHGTPATTKDTTAIVGILKGNGSTVSAAIAGDFPTLNQNTTGTAANLSGTPALPNGATATTQSPADNSTKLATTAYVDTGLGGKAAAAHAASHVTGGGDVIANVVAAGNSGLMTGADKTKLDGIASGATANAGTVTLVTAGSGLTQSGTASINPTLDVVSHAGAAGSIGTLAIAADSVGVSLGITSTTACAGNDSRLTDPRTPTAHNQAESTITFTDVTTGNASTSSHGFFPKLPIAAGNYLKDDMTWGTPTAAAGDLSLVLSSNSTINANCCRIAAEYYEVSSGYTLEIASGGILEVI